MDDIAEQLIKYQGDRIVTLLGALLAATATLKALVKGGGLDHAELRFCHKAIDDAHIAIHPGAQRSSNPPAAVL